MVWWSQRMHGSSERRVSRLKVPNCHSISGLLSHKAPCSTSPLPHAILRPVFLSLRLKKGADSSVERPKRLERWPPFHLGVDRTQSTIQSNLRMYAKEDMPGYPFHCNKAIKLWFFGWLCENKDFSFQIWFPNSDAFIWPIFKYRIDRQKYIVVDYIPIQWKRCATMWQHW